MSMSSDPYLRERSWHTNVSARGVVAAGDSADVTVAALKTGWTIYVQRIHVHILTSTSAIATFRDSNGTPVVFTNTDATPGADAEYHWDFGPGGAACTEAKSLLLHLSAAGLAFNWYVEAFLKQTGVERVASGIGVNAGTGQQFS